MVVERGRFVFCYQKNKTLHSIVEYRKRANSQLHSATMNYIHPYFLDFFNKYFVIFTFLGIVVIINN